MFSSSVAIIGFFVRITRPDPFPEEERGAEGSEAGGEEKEVEREGGARGERAQEAAVARACVHESQGLRQKGGDRWEEGEKAEWKRRKKKIVWKRGGRRGEGGL